MREIKVARSTASGRGTAAAGRSDAPVCRDRPSRL